MVFLSEFLKILIFNQSFSDAFKSLRIGLPLFSSLILLWQGIKPNIKIVWKVLLWAISISVLISILSIFINLPIYYNIEDSGQLLTQTAGRLMNSNASFGIAGLYLLFGDKNKWYNKGKLPMYTSILSIISLVLAFNRTYLTLLFIGFIYLSFKKFKSKNVLKIILLPLIGLTTVYVFYINFGAIQHQVDKRILSIIYQETTIAESTINNNRDIIYEGIYRRIREGYWAVGLPFNLPIFTHISFINHGDEEKFNVTDTSFITILLRYGIIPLILLSIIYFKFYKISKGSFFNFVFIIYLMASLNVDALFRQNSVFFLIVIFLVSNIKMNEKSSFHSKDQFK